VGPIFNIFLNKVIIGPMNSAQMEKSKITAKKKGRRCENSKHRRKIIPIQTNTKCVSIYYINYSIKVFQM